MKTLFRWSEAIEALDIHRTILKEGVTSESFIAINSAKKPMDEAFFNRRRRRPFNRMSANKDPYKLGHVLHFSIRTPDMFALKKQRGDGYYTDPQQIARNDEFYRRKNFNSHRESGHLTSEAPVSADISRLLQDNRVRKISEQIDARTKAGLAAPSC
ncbi:hypothetical protein LA304_03985 [Celeribacter sp. ASW11-22]|nr:hypothetical protein [Celeribacter litoreus]